MYELLQTLAINNEWVFEYSKSDYQNLYDDMTTDKVHLFIDPITIDTSFSDAGVETHTYSGKLMLLVSSDVDEDYKDKYINNIKPLMNEASTILKNALVCADATINKFTQVEVINLFDFNLDGLLITYSITLIE
ncbi:hypothetical protein [Flavobacterium muglaense]|uniref:Uncharacterized protein n=1 Tax=Flavobacterium muglaense TaxID=2764716 RepID=A0A923SE82_9FLAO|nr:hypothetical protein [Flavobacterium muglaense]MBC5836783.1 hypothetical protein [Flavobacterium muglaense]MBC5843267.1 hypothetical protein [Flavobacterium muglaense]